MNSAFTPVLSIALIGVVYACGGPDRPSNDGRKLESPAWESTETTGVTIAPAGKELHHYWPDAGGKPNVDRDLGPAVR